MKNIFVEKMRLVMSSYWELRKTADAEIEANKIKYSPEYADMQNKALSEKKAAGYEDAVSEIRAIYEKVREYLARGNNPSGAEMNQDDIALLDADMIQLTDKEIELMAQKYRDSSNFTMMRVLATWAERNGRVDIDFPLPLGQLKAYHKFAEAALYTVRGIYSEKKDHFIPLEIEHFGDEIMNADLYRIVGNGEKLQECAFKPVISDEALHVFDNIAI